MSENNNKQSNIKGFRFIFIKIKFNTVFFKNNGFPVFSVKALFHQIVNSFLRNINTLRFFLDRMLEYLELNLTWLNSFLSQSILGPGLHGDLK
jgi:hypothetical protein